MSYLLKALARVAELEAEVAKLREEVRVLKLAQGWPQNVVTGEVVSHTAANTEPEPERNALS